MTRDTKAEDIIAAKEEESRKKAVADLIDKAKGEGRSFREFARAAGVSPPSLSRIRKGDYLPSPDTIKKLTSEAADPQGGVTYSEMMQAAGYLSSESEGSIEISVYGDNQQRSSPRELQRNERAYDRQTYIDTCKTYEKEGTSSVYTTLVDKGIMFRKVEEDVNESEYRRSSSQQLTIEIMDRPITKWRFRFVYFSEERVFPGYSLIFNLIGFELKRKYNEDTKLSFVVNSKRTYQYLKRFDHALSFRGELSVVLYDYNRKKFVDEFYLSNYHEEDQSRELYLIGNNKQTAP